MSTLVDRWCECTKQVEDLSAEIDTISEQLCQKLFDILDEQYPDHKFWGKGKYRDNSNIRVNYISSQVISFKMEDIIESTLYDHYCFCKPEELDKSPQDGSIKLFFE